MKTSTTKKKNNNNNSSPGRIDGSGTKKKSFLEKLFGRKGSGSDHERPSKQISHTTIGSTSVVSGGRVDDPQHRSKPLSRGITTTSCTISPSTPKCDGTDHLRDHLTPRDQHSVRVNSSPPLVPPAGGANATTTTITTMIPNTTDSVSPPLVQQQHSSPLTNKLKLSTAALLVRGIYHHGKSSETPEQNRQQQQQQPGHDDAATIVITTTTTTSPKKRSTAAMALAGAMRQHLRTATSTKKGGEGTVTAEGEREPLLGTPQAAATTTTTTTMNNGAGEPMTIRQAAYAVEAMKQLSLHQHKLPPLEQTPLIAIRFTEKASTELEDLVQQRLQQAGLIVIDKIKDDKRTVMTLTATRIALEEQAQRIHLMKKVFDNHVYEYFTMKDRSRFFDKIAPYKDPEGLFSASEWALLSFRALEFIKILPPNQKTPSKLSELLEREYDVPTFIQWKEEKSKTSRNSAVEESLRELSKESARLRHTLQEHDLVDVVTMVHLPKLRNHVMQRTWLPWYRLTPPVDLIQSYYGWEVAYYFAWMGFLCRWSLIPGVVGAFVTWLRWYRNDTIESDEYTPFYGIFGFLWAITMLRYWDRYQNSLSFRWGTFSLTKYERQKFFARRTAFQGFLRISPVTEQPEPYYPESRRRWKYVIGALITTVMLHVAFLFMILSLNIQGLVDPSLNPERWNEDRPHPFHIPTLSNLAEPGNFFDNTSWWRSYIPVLLHIVSIKTLNYIYGLIADALTEWENHETRIHHNNSLIMKRFLFEAADAYISLFYLAFYERDMQRLYQELTSLFQVDTFRRLLMECIIPNMIQRFTINRQRKESPDSFQVQSDIPNTQQIMDDIDRDSYDPFDDYIEIIIQLGYVTLFASAYPLASLLSVGAIWVEIRSDCFKLAHLCQRPTAIRSFGIGTWRDLMACIIWTSALTNCLIVGFSSEQLEYYLPTYYLHDQTGHTDMNNANSWVVIFIIFALEHILVVLGMFIHAIIPEVPEDIADQIEKQNHLRLVQIEERRTMEKALSNKKTN